MKSDVKFKPLQPVDCSVTATSFIFKNPAVYFALLIFVSTLFILLSPRVQVLKDSENYEIQFEEENSFNDFHVNTPSYQNMQETIAINERQNKLLSPQCRGFKDNERFDCLPSDTVSEDDCISRGCCWAPVNTSARGELGVPFCYYPSNYKSYKYINTSVTDFGATAYLQNLINSSYPNNIQLVKIDFNYLSDSVLQVKIYDANHARFESPFPKISMSSRFSPKNVSYVVAIDKERSGFNVIRKQNNQSIFNAQDIGGFIFADQMLQLSARLPSNRLYGLGQQRNDFQLDMNWRRVTLFNHDTEPADKTNLYGTHPFYLAVEDKGYSSGVFLHNTNAMDIILQPTPAITYRTIGGVLDFFIFLGPSPGDVIRQYTELIGRPFMPPYWSLGFHLCRYGYNSTEETIKVWNRTRAAGIPLDTQWNDIDYMERHNDFTYDKSAFKSLPQFVDLLHKEGMHYIVILDPGVSGGETPGTYPPYDEGIKDGIFVKDPHEEKPFISKVWNDKSTVFPDFFHPKTEAYWQRQISQLHKTIPFDGLWIDMNDPSTEWNGGQYGCPLSPFDKPPYLPAVDGKLLYSRTMCMSARHYDALHYDVHNIFGSQEAVLTAKALRNVTQKRPFVISRSSYPGHGHFSGVWTGDINSSWEDMSHSISDILSFSLFGIPMSGADICGFNRDTTPALCQRWSQLGAFYPFSRNHNSIENKDQDPVSLGPAVVEAARKALLVRYSLLPYLYTLFWHAYTRGDTVARPMFVEFPNDDKTYTINTQFLWGSALLIAPLLSEEKTYGTAYLPAGRWYDYYVHRPISSKGSTYLLPTESGSIPLMLNGGNIIPTQGANTTTTASRNNAFKLIVALCSAGNATGDLYWDDGDSVDFENGIYNYIRFHASGGTLTSTIEQWRYKTTLNLGEIKVLGVEHDITKVVINGNPAHFSYSSDIKFLNVTNLSVDLSRPITMSWS